MSMLPKVIVTGMANSGTSFTTELVSTIGFRPGSKQHLKPKDGHNRYGYWEHLPMRALIWRYLPYPKRKIPWKEPMRPSGKISRSIQELADSDNIEVLKCFMLPWAYPWFEPTKTVFVQRSMQVLYDRYYGGVGWDANVWRSFYTEWHDIAAKYLCGDWDVLWVKYEDFFNDTENEMRRVCEYLGCPFRKELLKVFRPRRKKR